jgi:hypothetical protein
MSGIPPISFIGVGLVLLYCLGVVLTDKHKKQKKQAVRVDPLGKHVSNTILREGIRLSMFYPSSSYR